MFARRTRRDVLIVVVRKRLAVSAIHVGPGSAFARIERDLCPEGAINQACSVRTKPLFRGDELAPYGPP